MATDLAASMVGRLSSAITNLFRDSTREVYRLWCDAHQLDLAVQAALE